MNHRETGEIREAKHHHEATKNTKKEARSTARIFVTFVSFAPSWLIVILPDLPISL